VLGTEPRHLSTRGVCPRTISEPLAIGLSGAGLASIGVIPQLIAILGKFSKMDKLPASVKAGRLPLVGSMLRQPGCLRQNRPSSIPSRNWLKHSPSPHLGPPGEMHLQFMCLSSQSPTLFPIRWPPTPSTSHLTPHLPSSPKQTPQKTPLLSYSTPSFGHRESSSSASTMAYQRSDPRLFIPEGFNWEDTPDREFMSRAVAPMRPPATNEDLAIVTFNPLPGNELNFAAVPNIVREFLAMQRIGHRAVMPCHLGQAYVRFTHAYDRDNLVRHSPCPFGNIQLSFAKHNEGRN